MGKIRLGFSFIEILISLFILSLALLGLDAIHLSTLREVKSAYYFSIAIQQLNNMIERLSIANRENLIEEERRWNIQNQHALPQGHGIILASHLNYQLSIFWGKNELSICDKNTIGTSGCLRIIVKQDSL
ncbi:MAG TPA: hypothetical protein VJN02_04970 [Gammaproteobacteria bacterium]|nr:hypothetical protein [Gammaproteobacteria bacterium]